MNASCSRSFGGLNSLSTFRTNVVAHAPAMPLARRTGVPAQLLATLANGAVLDRLAFPDFAARQRPRMRVIAAGVAAQQQNAACGTAEQEEGGFDHGQRVVGRSTGVDDAGTFGPCPAYGEARFGLTVLRGLASGDGLAFGILFKGEHDSGIGTRTSIRQKPRRARPGNRARRGEAANPDAGR
jgi:hypothetical protein